MPYRPALAAAVVLATIAADQPAAEKVTFVPRLAVGEKRVYEVVKTREKCADGKSATVGRVRYEVAVEVLESAKSGHALAFSQSAPSVEAPAEVASHAQVEEMLARLKTPRVIVEFSEDWDVKGVRNWQEARDAVRAQISEAINMMEAAGEPADAVKAVRQALLPFVLSRSSVEQFSTSDAQLVSLVWGRELSRTLPVEGDVQVPVPVAAKPLTAKESYQVKRIDEKAGVIEVIRRMAIDKDSFAAIAKEVAGRLGKNAPPPETFQKLNVDYETRLLIDIGDRWPREIDHKKTGGDAERSQTDRIEYRLRADK